MPLVKSDDIEAALDKKLEDTARKKDMMLDSEKGEALDAVNALGEKLGIYELDGEEFEDVLNRMNSMRDRAKNKKKAP